MNYFKISMIDYKKDETITFTTYGRLTKFTIDGKSTTCIVNRYDVPIIIAAPSVIIHDESGKIIY